MRNRELKYNKKVEVVNLGMCEKASTAHPECELLEGRRVGTVGEISQVFSEDKDWNGWCVVRYEEVRSRDKKDCMVGEPEIYKTYVLALHHFSELRPTEYLRNKLHIWLTK